MIYLLHLWLTGSWPFVVIFADKMVIMQIKMLLSTFSVYSIVSWEEPVNQFRGAQLGVKKECKCIWNKEKVLNPINCKWEQWLALIKNSITRTMVINYLKTFTNRSRQDYFLTRKHPQVHHTVTVFWFFPASQKLEINAFQINVVCQIQLIEMHSLGDNILFQTVMIIGDTQLGEPVDLPAVENKSLD